MISRASNGIGNSGRIPFGYDYNPETMVFSINETEARVVRMIHDMYEEQRSLVRLARMKKRPSNKAVVSNLRETFGFGFTIPEISAILWEKRGKPDKA